MESNPSMSRLRTSRIELSYGLKLLIIYIREINFIILFTEIKNGKKNTVSKCKLN